MYLEAGELGKLMSNSEDSSHHQNNSTSERQDFLHSLWPFCDHPGGLWVSLATCLRGFCSALFTCFIKEGAVCLFVLCPDINKDKRAVATKQSFQKPSLVSLAARLHA